MIKRCNKILAHYEDQLHLVEKFLSIKEKVAQIHKLAEGQQDIEQICSEILEEL